MKRTDPHVIASGNDGDVLTTVSGKSTWAAPTAATGVQSVVPGTGITVDNTDPANPVVSATGGGSSGGGTLVLDSGAAIPSTTPARTVVFQAAPITAAQLDNFTVSKGPACYLPMQETSGTTATDDSGNGHPASYVNGPVLNDTTDLAAPTIVGQHVRLDGTDDYILLDATTTWFTPADNGFSLAGWFLARSWPNWARLFDFANGANVADIFMGANNAGTMSLNCNGSAITFARPSVLVWHHIAATVNNSGGASVYVDGALVVSGQVGAPVNQARQYKYVGKSASADPYLPGSVAKVSVFNRVLTSHEVGQLAGMGGGGALGWWDGTKLQPLA